MDSPKNPLNGASTELESSPPPTKKPRLDHTDSKITGEEASQFITESDVGITQYISNTPGIFAILKQRYSDFIVHELAVDGSKVQLTSFDIPQSPQEKPKLLLEDVFSASEITAIENLFDSGSKTDTVTIELKADLSKEERKSRHAAVREYFPGLESRTEDTRDGGKQIIIQRGGRSGDKRRQQWPAGRGEYCQFTLYKENKDTMEAVNLIARFLKLKSSTFHYSGTKDRRAITSQLITAYRVPAEKLLTINDSCKNIKVGNFKYVSEQLRLGDLSGNRFSIILRKLSCEPGVVDRAMTSLKELGFVNYFGMQRFGTSVVATHNIGRCLIHSEWEKAINIILKPRPGDNEEVNRAREHYLSNKDPTGALKLMPKWKAIEWQLLQGLERHAFKNNFLGALNFIPRNTRLMYVHSWQSYIWNQAVSWRLDKFGLVPIVGDLVYKDSCSSHNSKSEVVALTVKTVAEYTIHDIVLPLPGHAVQLPVNDTRDEILRLLAVEGVSLDQLEHRVKEFSLSGSYRHVVAKPTDVRWELLEYDDHTLPLFLTDTDLLEGKEQPVTIPSGQLKALRLEFNLCPSTYATMALREVLKMDTSSAYQTTLND